MSITPPNQNQRIHAPFRYFGSKSRRLGFVLPFLPEKPGARVYPFGGGGSVELNAPFNAIEVYNDLNGDAVNLFKIVANPQKLSQLLDMIFATPYSRAEFHRAFALTSDPIEQARRFLIRQQQSFGGLGRSFGVQVNRDGRNSSNMTRWAHLGETLQIVHNRVRHWIFECRDFERVITFYDRPTTAFYCDPPYIPSTRSGGKYTVEMTLADHLRLIDCLRHAQGMVVLSGYNHDIMDKLRWRRYDLDVALQISRQRVDSRRTESIWINQAAFDAVQSPNCNVATDAMY
ncbi:MAG: DNA adenine methylase [Candidatus Symbiobacter sp.]|nr:DNA adenine methylase [Candidatus Symbiobacter sp.]